VKKPGQPVGSAPLRKDGGDAFVARASFDWPGVVACGFAGILVVSLSWFKLSSLDIGYHVAYGRHFLDTGYIVGFEPDPFLMKEIAVPFVNANWGSQVVMALAERWGGPGGLIALRLVLIGIIFAGVAAVVRFMGASWLAVSAAWLLAALGAYERFSMRPELFSYAAMLWQLAIFVRGVRTWKSIVALLLLQIAWVNLHSYFLVGVFLSGAFWLDAAWKYVRRRSAQGGDLGTALRNFRRMSVVLGLFMAACTVHPWGYRGALFPLRTLEFLEQKSVMGSGDAESSKSAWGEITEFRSPFEFVGESINHRTIWAYVAMLPLAAVALVMLLRHGLVGPATVLLLMFLMSTQMRRNVAQFAMVVGPLAVSIIAACFFRNLDSPHHGKQRWFVAFAIVVISLALAADAASGRTYFVERRITREWGTGYLPATFPMEAVKWLSAHPAVQPELFVDYLVSSNVLPWLPERFKLFVNTNTFAYRDEALRTAFDLGIGKVSHASQFVRMGINAVLLHPGHYTQPLVKALMQDSGEWALTYVDPAAVIFVRRIEAHASLIRDKPASESTIDVKKWIEDRSETDAARALRSGEIAAVPISLGWWRSAEILCEEAVRLRSDYEEAWINLGISRANLANEAARFGNGQRAVAQIRSAIQCFERALEINPDNPVAAENLRRARQSVRSAG